MRPFDWFLYLDVAKALAQTPSEARLRSAVSRAYYGVFGAIRARLTTAGFRPSRQGRAHSEVITWLRQSGQEERQVGNELDRLRLERNEADYNALTDFTLSRAKSALRKADWIETRVKALL